ncbi:MAG: SURF1 family protein [Flaviflexus sp.]|nr:SURF1 family protein [Flaviflexus sp.]
MRQYSFLLSRRWISLFLIMVLITVACIFLGRWQYGRYLDKRAEADQVEQMWEAPMIAAHEVEDPHREEWRRVSASGSFIEGSQLQLRGRSVSGAAVIRAIALFRSTDGTVYVADRGWVPLAQAEGEVGEDGYVPEPPEGRINVTGRVRPGEDPHDRTPAPGYLYTLNPQQVLDALPAPVRAQVDELSPVRLELDGGQPPEPRGYPRPSTSLGNHLSYAWQWWFFAVAAQAVVPILARREASDHRWVVEGVDLRQVNLTEEEARDLGLLEDPKPARRRSRLTDEEIEDALLDEAEAR